MEFFVSGDPVPQPRPRVSTRGGFGRAYVPAGHPVHRYRESVATAAREAGVVVSDAAVSVLMLFTFVRPKSHRTKAGIRAGAPALPRADVDNLAKAVLDGLTCVAWHDAAQVAELAVKKMYGDKPSTWVKISDVE